MAAAPGRDSAGSSECPAIVPAAGKSPFSTIRFCRPRRSAKLGRMRTFLLPLLLLPALPLSAAEQAWRIDTVHTQIQFSIDHQGFNQSLGLFKASAGSLYFDADDWSTARLDVTVDAASILLGDAKWEETIRSWRFLDSERWPQARFVSESVQPLDKQRGIVRGQLTLHGKTRPLEIEFRLNKLASDPYTFKRTAGFSATARLKRSDFGMDKVLSAVGDEVQLRLEAAFVRDRDADGAPAPPPAATQDGSDGIQE
jgi:polyisoprenoid-binding protein YceI